MHSQTIPHLTLIRRGGGGANMPHRFSNAYSSGTKCRIDPKPGCKFEFVRCLKFYKKKIWTIKGPWWTLFLRRAMKKQEGPRSLVPQ